MSFSTTILYPKTIKVLKIFSLFFVLFLFFFYLSHRYEFFENGVGIRYFKSIIEDGDFNIFNQYTDPLDLWMATKSYNHPDYHSPFITVLLYIPYIFLDLFTSLNATAKPLLYFQIYFLLAAGIALILQRPFFETPKDDKIYKSLFVTLIFSTGAFWFTFFDPTEFSAVCLLISTFVFYEIYEHIKNPARSSNFLIFALGYFWILKQDGVFYVATVGLLFLANKNFKNIIKLMFSVAFFQLQLSLFNYIKLGTLDIKYFVVEFDHSFMWQYFFSCNGLFIKTPIYFLLFIAALFELFKLKNKNLLKMLYISLFAILLKAFVIGFIITPIPAYLASRHSISDTPAWTFIAYLSYIRRPKSTLILLGAMILFNIYHIYSIFLSYHNPIGFSYLFNSILPWSVAVNNFHLLIQYFNNQFNFIKYNFSLIIELSILGALFLTMIFAIQNFFPRFFKYSFITLILLIISSFSFLNYKNNYKNALKMKSEGAFNHAVIAKGAAIYYDEVFSIIEHNKLSLEFTHKPSWEEIEKFQTNYVKSTIEGIIYDPTDFSKNLKNNIVRKSFWNARP